MIINHQIHHLLTPTHRTGKSITQQSRWVISLSIAVLMVSAFRFYPHSVQSFIIIHQHQHHHTSILHVSMHPLLTNPLALSPTYLLSPPINTEKFITESRPAPGVLILTLDRIRKKNAITGAMYIDVSICLLPHAAAALRIMY